MHDKFFTQYQTQADVGDTELLTQHSSGVESKH